MSLERVRHIGSIAARTGAVTGALTVGPLMMPDYASAASLPQTEAPVKSQSESGPFDSPVPGMIQVSAGAATVGFIIRNRARSAQAAETMTRLQIRGDRVAEGFQDAAALGAFTIIAVVASRL